MSDKLTDRIIDVPHLAKVFDALRSGRHIGMSESTLYTALKSNFETFHALFAQLGFTLIHHPRDFFYFTDRTNFTEQSRRMALFVFILIEYLADCGDAIEDTLMSRSFHYAELPHLSSERYRRMMSEAGVGDVAAVEQLVRTMERFGFVETRGGGTFLFKSPAYRFLDVCLELASEQKDDKSAISTDESQESSEE